MSPIHQGLSPSSLFQEGLLSITIELPNFILTRSLTTPYNHAMVINNASNKHNINPSRSRNVVCSIGTVLSAHFFQPGVVVIGTSFAFKKAAVRKLRRLIGRCSTIRPSNRTFVAGSGSSTAWRKGTVEGGRVWWHGGPVGVPSLDVANAEMSDPQDGRVLWRTSRRSARSHGKPIGQHAL